MRAMTMFNTKVGSGKLSVRDGREELMSEAGYISLQVMCE